LPNSDSIRLSVVIPAYNEEERLGRTLNRVLEYLQNRGLAAEVLVVDDGSDDRTLEVAQGYPDPPVCALRLPENRGKGAALKSGVLASRGKWVLLCDADLSTPIEDLEVLESRAGEAPLILGSRAVRDSRVTQQQPFYREMMGKTFNRILRLLSLVEEQDTQCGFKLIRGDLARDLFADLSVQRFAYDVELVCLAKDRGAQVIEQGVRWEDSPNSRVHPIRDSANMLMDVLRLWLRRSRRS
jgi:dolichyl-phosphate beta-glucosyltransferase